MDIRKPVMLRDHLLKLPPLPLAALYLAVFLILDWVTYIPAFSPLGITPWNPSAGLAFAVILLVGLWFTPLLAIAPLLSDLFIRHLPFSVWIAVVEVLLTSISYAIGLWYLLRPERRFNPSLTSIRDLVLVAAFAVVSAAGVALTYTGVLFAAGLLSGADFTAATLRYWVGEVIGIAVLTPFLLVLFTHARLPRLTIEIGLQVLAIFAAIFIVFGIGVRYQSQLFYVLFLPIVWIALRTGFEGVTAGLVLMQIGIMIALHLGRHDTVDVTEFQVVMLILASAGLTIGILISERARTEARLRLQQDAIARAVRMGSMDRFTTSMAHEINQPLTAIRNYARAVVRSLERQPAEVDEARESARKTVAQVERAAEVIRRLRDLIRLGRAVLMPVSVRQIVHESLDIIQPDLLRDGVKIEVDIPRDVPAVMADLLQIEQVLTNLMRNAGEAMQTIPPGERVMSIAARACGEDSVEISVSDRGNGFPPGFRLSNVPVFSSVKPDGLGIGLTLCHSIIEAHGGRLSIDETEQHAVVRFTLRTAGGEDSHGPG